MVDSFCMVHKTGVRQIGASGFIGLHDCNPPWADFEFRTSQYSISHFEIFVNPAPLSAAIICTMPTARKGETQLVGWVSVSWGDSNPRPWAYEAPALSTELQGWPL